MLINQPFLLNYFIFQKKQQIVRKAFKHCMGLLRLI